MKKRFLKITFPAIVFVLIIAGTVFYLKYFAGLKPAVIVAPENIARLVAAAGEPLSHPPEFELSIFAEGLGGARVLTFDPTGTLLVSVPEEGRIVALPDDDHNGQADRTVTVVSGLNRPHGIAFAPGDNNKIYIAETDGIRVFKYNPGQMEALDGQQIIKLPADGRHYTRTILFFQHQRKSTLLISVGSSCDTCIENDWQRAAILMADRNGENLKVFASGLRNSVFMTVHPKTGRVWATEMGRDFLGDNLPPDEINIIEEGKNYGWPYCYGKNIRDSEFSADDIHNKSCNNMEPSAIDIQAHSAPLGLDFFPAGGWPREYKHNLLVAYHGSWNRSVPTGYKVVLFRFDVDGKLLDREDFITGWLQNDNSSLGRPVDVNITADGKIFISDDKAGVVYQLTLKE